MKKVMLSVEDMKCDGCVDTVRSALTGVKGVRVADVSLEKGEAHVEMEDDVTVKQLLSAVREAGYKAAPIM